MFYHFIPYLSNYFSDPITTPEEDDCRGEVFQLNLEIMHYLAYKCLITPTIYFGRDTLLLENKKAIKLYWYEVW